KAPAAQPPVPGRAASWRAEGAGRKLELHLRIGRKPYLPPFRQHVSVHGPNRTDDRQRQTDRCRNVAERNAEKPESEKPARAHRRRIVRVNHMAITVWIEVVVPVEVSVQGKKRQRRGDKPGLRVGQRRASFIVKREVVVVARL